MRVLGNRSYSHDDTNVELVLSHSWKTGEAKLISSCQTFLVISSEKISDIELMKRDEFLLQARSPPAYTLSKRHYLNAHTQ